MTIFSRRAALLCLAALTLSGSVYAAEATSLEKPKDSQESSKARTKVQVVYHVADGIEQAQRALGNAFNHLRAEPDTKIVIVALAYGVDFLVEGAKDKFGNPFADRVASLSTMGVQFRVCNNTLKGAKIDPATLLLEAKIVTSGVAEIARLQAREGYVYLRP